MKNFLLLIFIVMLGCAQPETISTEGTEMQGTPARVHIEGYEKMCQENENLKFCKNKEKN